jgi:hypothetical protein
MARLSCSMLVILAASANVAQAELETNAGLKATGKSAGLDEFGGALSLPDSFLEMEDPPPITSIQNFVPPPLLSSPMAPPPMEDDLSPVVSGLGSNKAGLGWPKGGPNAGFHEPGVGSGSFGDSFGMRFRSTQGVESGFRQKYHVVKGKAGAAHRHRRKHRSKGVLQMPDSVGATFRRNMGAGGGVHAKEDRGGRGRRRRERGKFGSVGSISRERRKELNMEESAKSLRTMLKHDGSSYSKQFLENMRAASFKGTILLFWGRNLLGFKTHISAVCSCFDGFDDV